MYVVQIIIFGILVVKVVLRDIGRVFGISLKEVDQFVCLILFKLGMMFEEVRWQFVQLNRWLFEFVVFYKVFQIVRKIEGFLRYMFIYVVGVVFSKELFFEVVFLQEGYDGVYLMQYVMDYLEDFGFLKMDFLGLCNLMFIEFIKMMIEKEINMKIDFFEIFYQDEKMFLLLLNGDMMGIFQLELLGMRNVLKCLKLLRFEDIVVVNVFYRLGLMENILLFIDWKYGWVCVEVLYEDVRNIFSDMYGVIVY